MMARLAHRGPDDAGYHLGPRVALGHRRLSIIDRRLGRQPLGNEDQTLTVVYNGEIYNHVELRGLLVARGHRFRTRSDTEVLVHAYEEWGPGCVERLRGMFAFALWDERRRRLLCARDRLGIKPLYYAVLGDDLVFASELKALLCVAGLAPELDDDALAQYLQLRYVPGARTLLQPVLRLPPAHTLLWHDGAITLERYWELPDPRARGGRPTRVAAAHSLRQRVDEATGLRLMSEVPVGAFLSGGLDSTVVTAAMIARGAAGLHTFSVGYADQGTGGDDERAWARLAARALGTQHHEVRVAARQVADELSAIVWALDEPVADPAAVPLYFLARRAKEEVTVVLSGEGADELLAGYALYPRVLFLHRVGAATGRLRPPLLALLEPLATPRARRLLGHLDALERSYRGVARAFARPDLDRLWPGRANDRLVELFADGWARTRGWSPLRRLLAHDLDGWLPDELLLKADRMTMAHGVELRVPLLDHVLVEETWRLPDEYLLEGRVGKALLRRAARGRVPEAILRRTKRGFSTPVAAWLRGELYERARAALLSPHSLARARFELPYVIALLEQHRRGSDRSAELWPLVVLELWHEGLQRALDPRLRSDVGVTVGASCPPPAREVAP
jgi:asparagine synthase (glutamine-hydrolysing)